LLDHTSKAECLSEQQIISYIYLLTRRINSVLLRKL